MNGNPYALDGFGEGFERGMRIVANRQDQKMKQQEFQQRQDFQQEEMGMKRQEFGLAQKKAQQDYDIAAKKEAREEADAPTDRAYKKALASNASAEADLNSQKVKQMRRDNELETLSGFTESAKATGTNIATLMEKPGWIETGGEIADAWFGGNKTPPKPDFVPRMYDWINDTWADEINKGVGDKVGAHSRKENPNIPEDAVIMSKRVVGVHPDDPQRPKNFYFDLEVTARDKNGKIYKYNAPVTQNRSGEADDTVLAVPASKIHDVAKGAYALRAGIAAAHMDGVPPAAVAAMVRQHISGKKGAAGVSGGKPPADLAVAKVLGDANHADEKDPDKRLGLGLQDYYNMRNEKSFITAVNKYMDDNSVDQETAEQKVLESRISNKVGKPVRNNEGWSIEPLKE